MAREHDGVTVQPDVADDLIIQRGTWACRFKGLGLRIWGLGGFWAFKAQSLLRSWGNYIGTGRVCRGSMFPGSTFNGRCRLDTSNELWLLFSDSDPLNAVRCSMSKLRETGCVCKDLASKTQSHQRR